MQNINGLRVVAGGSWVDQYTFKASTLVIEGGCNLQASKRLQPFNQWPTARKQASKCLQASALQPAGSDQEASSRPKQMGVATSGRRPGTGSNQPARKQANGSDGWGGDWGEDWAASGWEVVKWELIYGPASLARVIEDWAVWARSNILAQFQKSQFETKKQKKKKIIVWGPKQIQMKML